MQGAATPVYLPPSDWSGVREVQPAPPVGEHPRVFFSAEEIPEIRNRLKGTEVGWEALEQCRAFSTMLRGGRAAFGKLGKAQQCFPNGQKRISNLGLHSNHVAYAELSTGNAGGMDKLENGVHIGALGGAMALEGFLCLVDDELEDGGARRASLATALAAWAEWELAQDPEKLGHLSEIHFALTYDMVHDSMSEAQREKVRRAIANVLTSKYYGQHHPGGYHGALNEPEAVRSNWVALDTFKLIVACCVEGETASVGLPVEDVDRWFQNAMRAQAAFFTYGFLSTGSPYEGMGKAFAFAAHQIAFARRGHNFFGHPHLRAYANRWLPAVLQPFGYSFVLYDLLGGTGPDPVRGKRIPEINDFIGFKFMYPSEQAVDFVYRNAVYSTEDWKSDSAAPDDMKFQHRGLHANNLLCLAIFASDAACDCSDSSRAAALGGRLDFVETQEGTLVSRSGFQSDAIAFQLHARQNWGGHTFADRGSFSLSALGRIFFCRPTGNRELVAPQFNGETLVDGQASKVTMRDGWKMRIPAKLAAWSAPGGAGSFATCDSTYSYCFEWLWEPYPTDGKQKLKKDFEAEHATFNMFRRSDNKIAEAYGDVPFFRFPDWAKPLHFEGVSRKRHNPMQQVLRTAGLVRGECPYVLVLDDICKDKDPHEYVWHAPIAHDLELLSGSCLPAGAAPLTDVVLREPVATGDRAVLVRVLSPSGDVGKQAGEPPAHRDAVEAGGKMIPRLVIQRRAVVAPEFLVLLFPFRWGQELPAASLEGDVLRVAIGAQQDIFTIHRRTVSTPGRSVALREFTLERGGEILLDYRGLVEPVEFQE